MEYKLIVAGIGPGSREYVLPEAVRAIEEAKVLVGGKRALAGFAREGQQLVTIGRDLELVVEQIRKHLLNSDVVVMVSGDPGFHSMLVRLRKDFTGRQLKVIPGLSSLQLAFARLGQPWQDAKLLSMHGKEQSSETLSYRSGRKLGLLTDSVHTPSRIAAKLLAAGWPAEAEAYVCANLSYADERIDVFTLAEMKNADSYVNCVVVVIT